MTGLRVTTAVVVLFALLFGGLTAIPRDDPDDLDVVYYDQARYPNIQCLEGRIIAETDPRLTVKERDRLWQHYGVAPGFEWIIEETGFTYHELEVRPYGIYDRLRAALTGRELMPRELPALIELMNTDPRFHWAGPDVLALTWADSQAHAKLPAGEEIIGEAPQSYGVSLIDNAYKVYQGGIENWAEGGDQLPIPLPDFEYYTGCAPQGTLVAWDRELAGNGWFMERYAKVYGNGQSQALAGYRTAGSPKLDPVTVCIADTGVYVNHPELRERLHDNAIDANYRNYRIIGLKDRPKAGDELPDRGAKATTGLPREAIKGRPASHGTCVAGVVARCTDGFGDGSTVRLLPCSLKSAKTMAITGLSVKSPISSFVKLVACLYDDFPVGDMEPKKGDMVRNYGNVRVVSVSASVPKSYFSDSEWRVVSNVIGKAAGSIYEDISVNDRTYVFAAGNEAQPEPNRPCEMDYIIGVTATMPFDPEMAWYSAWSDEGANMGEKCVAAPGHGIITSTLYPCPNLEYLPEDEFRNHKNFSTPPRDHDWREQTNMFSATSSATPQVSSLAALLYAQDPARTHMDIIRLIEDSVNGRTVSAPWGEARGLIDYNAALRW